MPKRSILIVFLILLFSASIFIFNITSVPILSNVVQQIVAPPKSLLYKIRTSRVDNKNKILSEENEKLRQKMVDYERLKRDNQALRDQFEASKTLEYKLLPAKVLGLKGNFTNPSALIIDQGERSGVKKGAAVIFKNNLIGKIEAVSPNFSKVSLLHDEKFSTLAVTSDTGALGIAQGKGDFILFDRVSINEDLREGQLLLSRGQMDEHGIGIPPDLAIGKVSSVNKNESLPTQSAKVETNIDAAQLNMVFIILP